MYWQRTMRWLLWVAAAAIAVTAEDETKVRTDLVRLIDFDVQIALTGTSSATANTRSSSSNENEAVDVFVLGDIVTDWMNDSFSTKSDNQGLIGNSTSFQTVALERRIDERRRALSSQNTEERFLQDAILFTASFSGVSLWERRGSNTAPIDPELVELLQRATFLEDSILLASLQAADDSTGLGSRVVDVRAFITPIVIEEDQEEPSTEPTTDNLEIIIIIAIIVACMAFGLLMFAVVWAWRTDRQKRETYKVNSTGTSSPSSSGGARGGSRGGSRGAKASGAAPEKPSNRQYNHSYYNREASSPPSEIHPDENNAYPDSVISEDISTSLTAYYKQGMTGGYGYPAAYNGSSPSRAGSNPLTAPKHRDFNDGASLSSMDSYGYSLDGYAPSLTGAPTQYGYPMGTSGANDPVMGKTSAENDDAEDQA